MLSSPVLLYTGGTDAARDAIGVLGRRWSGYQEEVLAGGAGVLRGGRLRVGRGEPGSSMEGPADGSERGRRHVRICLRANEFTAIKVRSRPSATHSTSVRKGGLRVFVAVVSTAQC